MLKQVYERTPRSHGESYHCRTVSGKNSIMICGHWKNPTLLSLQSFIMDPQKIDLFTYVTVCQICIFGPKTTNTWKAWKKINFYFYSKWLLLAGKKNRNFLIFAPKLVKNCYFMVLLGQFQIEISSKFNFRSKSGFRLNSIFVQ